MLNKPRTKALKTVLRRTANQKLLNWLLAFQTFSLVFLLMITWVDEELIIPDLHHWVPFLSPKLMTELLESFWLIVLFGLIIRTQIVGWRRIKLLEGVLPICAHCKRIRDEKAGRWTQIETYVSDKTGADFTHGICPDCLETHFGEYTHAAKGP
jgi:hypothetical protein